MSATTADKDAASVWPAVRRFIAGYASGISLVLVGHPFDTIKVRLQTDGGGGVDQPKRFNGVVDCVKQTVRKEGIKGLYKGMAAPLAMTGGVNCLLFGTQYNIVAQLEKMQGLAPGTASVTTTMQAAVMSGALIGLVVTPMEGIKARLQVQYNAEAGAAQYKGPIDCARKVYAKLGWKGIYRGHAAVTLCRMSNYSYFGAYAYFIDKAPKTNSDGSPVTGFKKTAGSLMAGSMAGVAYWLSCYPMDVIKNKLQAAPDTSPPKYRGIVDVAQQIWRTAGVRGFFVGFSACCLRAMPANAAAFAGFELAMSTLPS